MILFSHPIIRCIVQILNGVQKNFLTIPSISPMQIIIIYKKSLHFFTNCTKLGLLPCRKIFKFTAGNSHFSFLYYNVCTCVVNSSRFSLSIPSFQVLANATTNPRTSRFRRCSARIAIP